MEDIDQGKKNIVVIYHADCRDGFGSAYVGWKKFGDSADYLAAYFETEPPDVVGKDVYIFDYTYPRKFLEKIKKDARKLIMIDHHITNSEDIKIASEFVFDINHSGTVLVWKYFYPEKDIPKMFLYIEDIDLWRFGLLKSKEVVSFIDSQKRDFEIWDKLVPTFEDENKFKGYLAKGEDLVSEMNKKVSKIADGASKIIFEGYKTQIVRSDDYTSEVGHTLCRRLPPIGLIWAKKNGNIAVSLRGDGTVDVSQLAKKYGGGGHKNAAGFVLKNEEELGSVFKL